MGRLVQFPLNDYTIEKQYRIYYENEDECGFDYLDQDESDMQESQKLNWLRRFLRRYLGFDSGKIVIIGIRLVGKFSKLVCFRG